MLYVLARVFVLISAQNIGYEDDLLRELLGASVQFTEIGQVQRVSLPSDCSLAKITGLVPQTSTATVVNLLRGLGFRVEANNVRILDTDNLEGTAATVKVEDPVFAESLSRRFKELKSPLSAISLPTDPKQKHTRKVQISWHKVTRVVWMNFGSGEVANRTARKFNEGTYKCLGQTIKASTGKESIPRGGRRQSYNPAAWSIKLSHVPPAANRRDVERAILMQRDRPNHVEIGPVCYHASDAEVSVAVRSKLEEFGPLEAFYFPAVALGKRVKVAACFRDEAAAHAACSLNNSPIEILGTGKLTVTQMQTLKVKVAMRIYLASNDKIEEAATAWRRHHVAFHSYPDAAQRFTVLKLEGQNSEHLASARKTLDTLLSGMVLRHNKNPIWHPSLNSNDEIYKTIRLIEQELDVVIARDKFKRQLMFHGPAERYGPVVRRVMDLFSTVAAAYEIRLTPHQFSSAIQGAFGRIEQALGKNTAVFDVVSKIVTINGSQRQYEKALQILGRNSDAISSPKDPASSADCPICFDKPDIPVQMSCMHLYCLDCFQNCCTTAASTSKDGFQVKCHGDEGACSTIFTLREIGEVLPSSALEEVLMSSFRTYVQRKPDEYRYCPTPDCGYIYRCASASGPSAIRHTCPNCFEDICRSCHARHGQYTCAEYKDIASGGREALEKLKRKLNYKDCPKCATTMEKTEGCNHITCGGCRAHICWVCLAVFGAPDPCYEHMRKLHGGIGLNRLH